MELLHAFVSLATGSPSVATFASLAVIYATYYLAFVVKRPLIACGDKVLKEFLFTRCPLATESYWPTWWCFQAHFQTVMRALLQSHIHVDYQEEYLTTPDGGEIRLDWADHLNSQYQSHLKPTVLFLPGLTGSSRENYVLHMVASNTSMGYRSVVFNNRGTGGSILRTPRTYCAANIEDLKFVINHIRDKYPSVPLIGVGVSLGGIILFNYLASTGSEADLTAAMIISPVYNLHESRTSLRRPVNYWMFNRRLASNLRQIFQTNQHLFEDCLDIEAADVLKSKSIGEFDASFTSKLFGFESVDHYYTEASIHTKMSAVTVPTLCLSAADDPFAPGHSVPLGEAEKSKNICIVMSSHGGHIGFLEGSFPRHDNYALRWFREFISAVFQHGIKPDRISSH